MSIDKHMMLRMVELMNHRHVSVERDGYPQQNFEIHYASAFDRANDHFIMINAFNASATISIDTVENVVRFHNTAFDTIVKNKFNSQYDCLLYTYHLLCILSNNDTNNGLFVLTVLPTVFTILLKIYEELPETTDADFAEACKGIITHAQEICFDHNAIVISRKKY